MLQIKHISKTYQTGELIQKALQDVSLNFRNNEFIAILGPSGSGKTTLLNIIGGLDRYDSGDLIINGISTKDYKDRDWDSYRNHTIGFVFQSYNLIPHQSILANVELALTISGISKEERHKRAVKALEDVGLKEQIHKKPNQMSGGQMQRVAIARALVNDPDILLADEPTGALDTETSVQVMELLKKVAENRLVIMVTHNPQLAEDYATRIVQLRDGTIQTDSDPYTDDALEHTLAVHKNMGKSSMKWRTSLSLSFHNLMTKKARTILTAFAGSIGIIGIALILALSTGVNSYIDDIQKETMTSYPITIDAQSVDLNDIMGSAPAGGEDGGRSHEKDQVYSNGKSLESYSKLSSSITENNLTEFKKYLDDPNSEIHEYVGETGILYSYDALFETYAYDPNNTLVNTDGSSLSNQTARTGEGSPMSSMESMMSGSSQSSTFEELLPGADGEAISHVTKDSYDVLYGSWPQNYDEVVLVLDEHNEISLNALYALGILPSDEYEDLLDAAQHDEEFQAETYSFDYKSICKQTFYMIPASDTYQKQENGTYRNVSDDQNEVEQLLKNAVKLKITGVVSAKEDAANATISGTVGYTKLLSDYIIDYTANSEVVNAQQSDPDTNVLNGLSFNPSSKEEKLQDAKTYLQGLGVSDKAAMMKTMSSISGMQGASAASMSETQLSAMLDDYLKDPDENVLLTIYEQYISTGSFEDNMTSFGYISKDTPSSISIYTDSFEDKYEISRCIDDYNRTVSEDEQITYTDFVAVLMSSVTTIINVISYVLIAFVAVSLIVSSIMIGIITYISVLERTKEIGILRAMGASKHNITQVFNAETFIVGLCSGLMGVGIAALLLIPGNALIHMLIGTDAVNAYIPTSFALILIVLSMILTLIGGFIPARKAAKKDPVAALRSE